MAINDTKNLWESYNGKGFFAEAAEYSERANKDVNGNAIVDTYATKAEVTEKQDALPSSAANQFLQTNANNEITWGTLPEALDEVYIVTYGSSVSANTVSAERRAGKAVFCSKGTTLLPLQAIGSNICSFNGVIGAENSTNMNGLIMAHAELMATGSWSYGTISIPKPTGTSKTLTIDTDGTVAWTATPVIPREMTGATASTDGESGLVPAPSAGDEEKLLTGDGNWTALENDVVGTQLLDENGQPILDEESTQDNPIYVYDAYSTDQLWTGFAGKEFGAARAYADQDGNNIKATYATKEDLNTALGDIESRLAAL